MGANLYLASVLDDCFSRYGQAFHLVQALNRLLEGDLSQALVAEGQALKAALRAHAEQAGTMSPALFDLVAEIGDLAQGEGAVWEQALADQIATVLAQSNQPVREASHGTPWLADDLAEILKGRTDAALAHGLPWLVQRIERLVPQVPEEERALTQTLAELCRSLLDVQQGQPVRALALVVEKHVLPQLEQACADQASCLHDLAQVLQPLQSALAAREGEATEGVEFAPAQALSRWQQIAQRLHNVLAVLLDTLHSSVRQAPFPVHEAGSQICQAWEQAQEIWREGGVCQEELTEAMGTLGTLLVRTLPPLTETVAGEMQATPAASAPAAFPTPPTTSPLRQAFGIVFKHHLFCHAAIHLLEHAAAIAKALLTGDPRQAPLALCEAMIALLGAAQSSFHTEEEEDLALPLTHQTTATLATPVPLTAGVTLVPGTVMDTHFLGARASMRAMQQEQRAQEWVKHAFGDAQATHPGGLILSFWRLVQGETTLWALLLTRVLEVQLPGEMIQEAAATLRARLIQLQHLLHGDPLPRLQAVLSELEAAIPADSPLGPPTVRLQRLTQQQHTFALQEILQALSQEIQDQADRGAWPDDRIQDVRWLLDLSQEILQASVADQASLLLTTLSRVVALEAATETPTEKVLPTREREEFLALIATITNDQDRLQIVARILSTVPDPALHAPRADPRHDAWWRLRLFRDLVACALEEKPAAEDAEAVREEPCAWSLLEPLAAWMARLLLAWLFPPEGYFRDSYNDGSTLWVVAGLFWPAIAHIIVEPLDEQQHTHEGWHTGEDEIPAQIPVEHARHLVEFIATRTMHLPTREQLARWGETLPIEEEGPYSLSQWHAHLAERKQALLAFLEGAIAREEPILCSL
jgi:hypothetical protein